MFAYRHLDIVDSTNSEALRLIQAGAVEAPLAIVAAEQAEGRGTRGRAWRSGPGNLHASYVWPVEPGWTNPALAVYAVALAVRATLARYVSETVHVKWPNDALIDGAKVSGALLESGVHEGRRFLVAGVGANLAWKPTDDVRYPATCLADHLLRCPPAETVARVLGDEIARQFALWSANGFADVRRRYLAHAYRLGEEITVGLRGDRADTRTGVFDGVDEDGALLLRAGAVTERVFAADVFPALDR